MKHLLDIERVPMNRVGPFVTEDKNLDLPDPHNCYGAWQEGFRVGHLDQVAAREANFYADPRYDPKDPRKSELGVDELAITCIDRVQHLKSWKLCTNYDYYDQNVNLVDDYMGGNHPFYAVHNGRIEGLRPPSPGNLVRRCEFTEAVIREVRPDYEDFSNLDEMLEYLATSLRVSIGIKSYGPTAKDKISCR